jgi:hypothetical protein
MEKYLLQQWLTYAFAALEEKYEQMINNASVNEGEEAVKELKEEFEQAKQAEIEINQLIEKQNE